MIPFATKPAPPMDGHPEPMLPEPWSVTEHQWETRDTFTIRLEPVQSGPPKTFLPGQFNMLYAFGTGESAISISGDPASPAELIHTIRAVGPVTRALSRLRPGDMLGLRGPFGTAWPVEALEGHDLVFLAGGIGLAPLRPAIYAALARRERYGKIVILIGARSPDDIVFAGEVETWTKTRCIETRVSVDHAAPGWKHQVGVITTLIPKANFDPASAVALICGPEIMMRYSILELTRRGMNEDSIFLTMERNMKCAVGFCGHCQFGPEFICRDGPVFRHDQLKTWLALREL